MNAPSETRKSQTQALFNIVIVAPTYDAAGPASFAYFGRQLVELVGAKPGQRVLDVATGRGTILFPAAERAGPSGEVIGITWLTAWWKQPRQR